MAYHRGVKLCKAKGQYTENRTVNVRAFQYTRIWYTLWLVNFDRFCQHSSITDADEIYDMAAVRDLSTSNAMFKSVINNTLKDFPKCLRKEQKDCIKTWSMKDPFAILPTGFWKSLIFQLFPRAMSLMTEWRSRRHLLAIMVACLALSLGHIERPS